MGRHDPSGHHLPRRHAGHDRRGDPGFETQKADPLVGLAVKPFYPETGATERIDDFTAQFNLLEPNAFFAGALTGQLGYVSSPTWLAAALADPTLNQQPVGSGPFVFDSRSPDSVTRFVRNEDWWNGEVYLDAVEFVPVPDADTRAELLIAGRHRTPCRPPTRAPSRRSTRTTASSRSRTRPAKRASS